MNENIIKLIEEKPLIIPKILFQNYKKLNITEEELLIIIYLINETGKIAFNPETIANYFESDKYKIMEIISNLTDKKIIELKVEKINNITEEYISLDLLYTRIYNLIIEKKEDKEEINDDIFTIFETEFGRTLSPMEYEYIKDWIKNGVSNELIKEAIKEAVFNNVKNLNYIDKILYSWQTKGLKTKEDIMLEKRNYRKTQTQEKKVFDYNWLDDE